MDVNNPVIRLCLEGNLAEFNGCKDDARRLFEQAWEAAGDDYEACIAAHYVARFQETSEQVLHWNLEALKYADAVGDERVKAFYPSLYVNLGHAYEILGNLEEAGRYYRLAADLGLIHEENDKE
jgi:hypothetical protein